MKWNWQQSKWPNFSYDINVLDQQEQLFLTHAGLFMGVFKHIDHENQMILQVELLSEEALNTSAIEGETLNRESLQSSIKRAFGLTTKKQHITPAEQGITEMMLDCYKNYQQKLHHKTLYEWHKMLTKGRNDLHTKGAYRQHKEPMLIISYGKRQPVIHFEAPPSEQVKEQMDHFIEWFNSSAPSGRKPLPPLVRAGITHLYFESIHPFEDGNGRIGRALAIKALSQNINKPLLLSLSQIIEKNKKAYYKALQTANYSLEITKWLSYFAETILTAQQHTQKHLDFLINKANFFDCFNEHINERQRKILLRMFRAGPEGFIGGLSATNYISITKTSRATATRDLQSLVHLGALKKIGKQRYSRYYLNFKKEKPCH